MNNIQIFNNPEFGSVRSLMIEDEPWFVGKDVAEALGYSNSTKAVIAHVDEDDRQILMVDSSESQNGIPSWRRVKTSVINESGLYSLIFSSKLPKAKEFKHWVTSEVLPSIRKTGSYSMKQDEAVTKEDYFRAADILSRCDAESRPQVTAMLAKAGVVVDEKPKKQKEPKKIVQKKDPNVDKHLVTLEEQQYIIRILNSLTNGGCKILADRAGVSYKSIMAYKKGKVRPSKILIIK